MKEIPKPVNTQEEYLHAIAVRVDALCHMMSSFIDEYAKQNKVATTKNTVQKKPAPRKKKVSDDEPQAPKK